MLTEACNLYLDLTKYGSHVYVIVRRGELRASKIMAKRLLNNPKIVSLLSCEHLGVFWYDVAILDRALEYCRC